MRVLVVGPFARATGFARVLRSLIPRLMVNNCQVVQFGIDYRGDALVSPWNVEPNRILGDPLGARQLPALLVAHKPDVVLFLHDYWFVGVHRNALEEHKRLYASPRMRVVVYCPIEWDSIPAGNLGGLGEADAVVAFTLFGRRVIASAFATLRAQGRLRYPPLLLHLPHGVDTSVFRPLTPDLSEPGLQRNRVEARRRLFPGRPDLDTAFIVLNANRNVPRKRLDLTMRAFAAFAAGKPKNVHLYLHGRVRDTGIQIPEVAARLGIERRLLMRASDDGRLEVSDQWLNEIYNACDVGLNTSTGEGWGLVSFEHGATGAAQIVPWHSACGELWEQAGLLAQAAASPRDDADVGIVSIADVSRILERCYSDRSFLAKYSRRAFDLATSPIFSWDIIGRQWSRLLHDLVSCP